MIGYLDLPSGLSGDMLLGCLVDCGWGVDRIRNTIEMLSVPAGEWAVVAEPVAKGSLRATRVDVLVDEPERPRRLYDITETINDAPLPELVKSRAIAIFTRLARAEARVHGTTIDHVHFHEVGAMDAIVDIVASVNGLYELKIDTLYASPVPLGPGWTPSAHGQLPLPSPATLELLAGAGAPTRPAPGPGELLTPTGAAILAELAIFQQPAMSLQRIGVGAGQRDCAWPNIARLWLGDLAETGEMVQLETNIDDMNPQLYANVSDRLFAAGARDVWLTPVQMKKGRPGVVLAALGRAIDESKLAELILRHTTSLGVRVHALRPRHEARREMRSVSTPFGDISVKLKWLGDELVNAFPEYEDCRAAAERNGASVLSVHQAAQGVCASLIVTAGATVAAAISPDAGSG